MEKCYQFISKEIRADLTDWLIDIDKEKNEYRTDELSISITSNEYNRWIDSISHLY